MSESELQGGQEPAERATNGESDDQAVPASDAELEADAELGAEAELEADAELEAGAADAVPEPEAVAEAAAETEAAETETEAETEAEADALGDAQTNGEAPDPVSEFKEQLRLLPGDWYVVHSYAGYENRVRTNLESRTQSLNMEDFIFQIEVPTHEVTEIKSGKRQQVQEKVLPGYILVRMDLTDESWAAVRNTPDRKSVV